MDKSKANPSQAGLKEDEKTKGHFGLGDFLRGSEKAQALLADEAQTATLKEYYFPAEIIGGCAPLVRGNEQDIAWHAAAEACDTERVHLCWRGAEGRVWYLAVRSADLSSHPATWCPFTALLPGMPEAKPAPIVYTFFSEETATMMSVGTDTLQIHRGTPSVIRAKAEKVARELGSAAIFDLIPDVILKMTPVPWTSLSLLEDRVRRLLSVLLVLAAMGTMTLAFAIWLLASMTLLTYRSDLDATKKRNEEAALALLQSAASVSASPLRQILADFTVVDEGLVKLGGFLEHYKIENDQVRWRALVPSGITADNITALGGQTLQTTEQGFIIGNPAEASAPKTGTP